MLYDSWLRISEVHANTLALRDLATGRCWTFAQLRALVEESAESQGKPVFPSGNSAHFVIQVLKAWRSHQIVCPLECGQTEPAVEQIPENIIHLKSTSATTGVPRLVTFTAPQLMADAAHIVETMGLRPEWPNLGLISLAHSYGFSNLVLPLLLHGIPLVLAGSALPESVRQAAQTCEAVTIAGVPALWRTWFDAGAISANVRLAISAGAPLPADLEQEVFTRCGLKIHNFYGSTECGGIAYDTSEVPRSETACVGAALPGVSVTLATDGGVEVRGAAVGETYWPEPSPRLRHGRFLTSDLGEFKNGLLYLRGRATDQINVAGRKVLPEAIEAVLSMHPQVRACLAFGIPGSDPQRGETIVACVAGHSEVTAHNLKQFALARLPAWQVPREWWVVDTLDVNQRGKLSRAEWRKRYLDRHEKKRSGTGTAP